MSASTVRPGGRRRLMCRRNWEALMANGNGLLRLGIMKRRTCVFQQMQIGWTRLAGQVHFVSDTTMCQESAFQRSFITGPFRRKPLEHSQWWWADSELTKQDWVIWWRTLTRATPPQLGDPVSATHKNDIRPGAYNGAISLGQCVSLGASRDAHHAVGHTGTILHSGTSSMVWYP